MALSMQKLWQVILEQKDLNLPAHKVSPPTVPPGLLLQIGLTCLQPVASFLIETTSRKFSSRGCLQRYCGQVMVANIRCAEIAEEQLRAMSQDQAWLALRSEAASELVSGFGARTTALIHSCLAGPLLISVRLDPCASSRVCLPGLALQHSPCGLILYPVVPGLNTTISANGHVA